MSPPWSVALMPTVLFVDSCSQLVRCVWDTNTSYHPTPLGNDFQLRTRRKQCVCAYLFGPLNVCIPVSAHLHVSWRLWTKWVLTSCFLDSVLSTWRSTCVSCHILLIGAFHWFQSGWPVHKLCLLIVFSRNKWENPCGSEQPILFSSPSSNILNDV